MYIFEGSLQQQRGSRPWLTWQACSGLLEENGLGPNELFEKNRSWEFGKSFEHFELFQSAFYLFLFKFMIYA
jgi:hypothetical protein